MWKFFLTCFFLVADNVESLWLNTEMKVGGLVTVDFMIRKYSTTKKFDFTGSSPKKNLDFTDLT